MKGNWLFGYLCERRSGQERRSNANGRVRPQSEERRASDRRRSTVKAVRKFGPDYEVDPSPQVRSD